MKYTKKDLENLGFSLAEDPEGQYLILRNNEPVTFKLCKKGKDSTRLRVYVSDHTSVDYTLLLRTLLGGNDHE